MKFTENEIKTIEAVFNSLSRLPYEELNRFLGSMTIADMTALNSKLRYRDYCERHGITYEEMTEDDFMDAYYEAWDS